MNTTAINTGLNNEISSSVNTISPINDYDYSYTITIPLNDYNNITSSYSLYSVGTIGSCRVTTTVEDQTTKLEARIVELEKKLESMQTTLDKILKSLLENGNVTITL